MILLPHRPFRLTLRPPLLALLCALGLAAARPAAAQGPFETDFDAKTRISGLDAGQVQRFRQRVAVLLDDLKQMPEVMAPPPTVCMRLRSFLVAGLSPDGMAEASVSAMMPISFANGRCHRMTGSGVEFLVNHARGLFSGDRLISDVGRDGESFYLLDLNPEQERVIWLGRRTQLLLREPGRHPWRPVPRQRFLSRLLEAHEAHLARVEKTRAESEVAAAKLGMTFKVHKTDRLWTERRQAEIAALREALAADTPEQALQPACHPRPPGDRGPCPLNQTVMEVNPGFWQTHAPERVQLLLITTSPVQDMQESKDKFETRMRLRKALDAQRLLAWMDGS